MKNVKVSLLIAFLAAPALAQTNGTYVLTSTNTVTPSSPTTTIGVWAAWDDPAGTLMFGAGDYDLTASDGQFFNPVNVLNAPGTTAGVVAGNVVTGAANGQIYFSPFFPGLRDNPILLATYDWTTTNFTPRAVSLHTSNTSIFIVFSFVTGGVFDLYPNEFTPGSGVINVVPAPAVWLALALPLVVARRRRRC